MNLSNWGLESQGVQKNMRIWSNLGGIISCFVNKTKHRPSVMLTQVHCFRCWELKDMIIFLYCLLWTFFGLYWVGSQEDEFYMACNLPCMQEEQRINAVKSNDIKELQEEKQIKQEGAVALYVEWEFQYCIFLSLTSILIFRTVTLIQGWTFQVVMHSQSVHFLTPCFWGCSVGLLYKNMDRRLDMLNIVSDLGQQEWHTKECLHEKVWKVWKQRGPKEGKLSGSLDRHLQ